MSHEDNEKGSLCVCGCSMEGCAGVSMSKAGGVIGEIFGEEKGEKLPIYLCRKHKKLLSAPHMYLLHCLSCGNNKLLLLDATRQQEADLDPILLVEGCMRCKGEGNTVFTNVSTYFRRCDERRQGEGDNTGAAAEDVSGGEG